MPFPALRKESLGYGTPTDRADRKVSSIAGHRSLISKLLDVTFQASASPPPSTCTWAPLVSTRHPQIQQCCGEKEKGESDGSKNLPKGQQGMQIEEGFCEVIVSLATPSA